MPENKKRPCQFGTDAFVCNQNCSSISMRFRVSGWVLNSELKKLVRPGAKCCGCMMNSWAMSSRLTFSSPGSPEILRKAEARASGLPHSSAPPASAMYSRLREIAKRVSNVNR